MPFSYTLKNMLSNKKVKIPAVDEDVKKNDSDNTNELESEDDSDSNMSLRQRVSYLKNMHSIDKDWAEKAWADKPEYKKRYIDDKNKYLQEKIFNEIKTDSSRKRKI